MMPNNVKLSWFGLFDDVILPSHCRFEGGIYLMGRVIFLSRPTRTLKFLACTAFIIPSNNAKSLIGGVKICADEYFGIDTCDVIDVEGVGNSLPAIRTCDVVLQPS